MSTPVTAHAQDQDIYPFLTHVGAMRQRARAHIKDGASTANEATDRATLVSLLNAALATELMCVQRYRELSALPDAQVSEALKGEFVKRAREEQAHADQIAERIVQLGGAANEAAPRPLDRQLCAAEDESLLDLLEEDLIAERVAIEAYQDILQYVSSKDDATRRLFEHILVAEHAQTHELATLRSEMMHQGRPTGPP
jgi:bacterioferritin